MNTTTQDRDAHENRALLRATREFAKENPSYSWWVLLSTLALFAGAMTGALVPWFWGGRLIFSLLSALLMVRLFVIYHDYQHNAILSKSKSAESLMKVIGLFTLAPSSVWKHFHNTHHSHNSKLHSEGLGSFPVMTRERYAESSLLERIRYRVTRHPVTIFFGYITAFLGTMCLMAFLENPKRHYDGLLAILLHAAIIVSVVYFLGWVALFFGVILPFFVAAGIGSYLFYAQHNFPSVLLMEEDGWTFEGAALDSSSYMKMPKWMQWFTANIGYHHIHHLNSRIPFYRLPEAFQKIPELQEARTTSLHPLEVIRCLRLKVWDSQNQKLVPR